MALIRLDLEQPSVTFRKGEGLLSEPGWGIRWTARTEGWGSVALSNGRDMAKMPGSLWIKAGEFDPAEAAKEPVREGALPFERPGTPVGLIHYLPAQAGSADGVMKADPDSFSVELKLPEEELRRLIDKTQGGISPKGVTLSVPGLQYGYAPDGSDLKWDLGENGERTWRIVDEVTFWFGEEPVQAPDDDAPPAGPEAAPRSAEAEALQELTRQVRSIGNWVVSLLLAILVALLLYRH